MIPTLVQVCIFVVVFTGLIGTYLTIRSARQRQDKHTVFRVTTSDGNQHEVLAHNWVEWVALRSLERRGLPSQEDMRYMLRHMDDAAVDKTIYELLTVAMPRVRRSAQRGGINLDEN